MVFPSARLTSVRGGGGERRRGGLGASFQQRRSGPGFLLEGTAALLLEEYRAGRGRDQGQEDEGQERSGVGRAAGGGRQGRRGAILPTREADDLLGDGHLHGHLLLGL